MADTRLFERAGEAIAAAKAMDGRIFGIEGYNLDDVFWAASHKLWRVKVTAGPDGGQVGSDNAVAWWPADEGVFGHEAISALCTDDGNIGPSSHTVGGLQIHRDVLVWTYWNDPSASNGLDFGTIEWNDLGGSGTHLYGPADDGKTWQISFDIWYAGYPPQWPTWLLD